MSDVVIEARDLTKRYGPVNALKNVSFEVRKGEVLGFLGPNGAGKTTTMKILTCFIAPTEGTAKVNGYDIFDDSIGVRTSIGYLPESTPLYTEMLALEYLEFMTAMRGFQGSEARKRLKKAVDATAIGDVLHKEVRALSKGYRQRVGLAQALVHEPPILILDEPLSGLDPNQAQEIRELIKTIGRERTVILSTHDLGEVTRTCDRVLIINKGKIVADDRPDELTGAAAHSRFTVAILAKGDRKDLEKKARAALGEIANVDAVRPNASKDSGELRFDVLATGKQDLRPDIFQAAVDAGLVMIGLERQAEDLGRVFKDLTLGAEDRSSKKKSRPSRRAEPEPEPEPEEDEDEDEDEELEDEDEPEAADDADDDAEEEDEAADDDDEEADEEEADDEEADDEEADEGEEDDDEEEEDD